VLNNLYGRGLARHCLLRVGSARSGVLDVRLYGGIMSMILAFASNWVRWYRVLRYAKAFTLVASVRYGLWLARS
jgi:hypothetical protein